MFSIVAGGAVARAGLDTIDGPGEVTARAERIAERVVGTGLTFPIDPEPVCEVLDNFGGYSKSFGSGGHQGVDIGADFRQAVVAVEDGVLYREFDGGAAGLGWGLWSDTDWKYRYYHLDELAPGLAVGDRVTDGQLIGWVGDTGNATAGGWHLHFEARPGPHPRYGSADPVDPVPLLDIPETCNVY